MTYGFSVQSTRDTSVFGKGEGRGVIGPRARTTPRRAGASRRRCCSAFPGSGSMAIFIGAIALLGSGDMEVGSHPRLTCTPPIGFVTRDAFELQFADIFDPVTAAGASETMINPEVRRGLDA